MLGIPLAALILVAATFPPQQPSQSMLKIRVQDGTGASIPDATVQIQSEGSEHNIARTDQNGKASVTLDPGRYKLLVQGPRLRNVVNQR